MKGLPEFKRREIREMVKTTLKHYLRDMALVLYAFIILFFLYFSGVEIRLLAYDIVGDIINAIIDAILNTVNQLAPNPQTILQQALGYLGWLFINEWDLKMAIIGFLIGLFSGGDFGESFITYYSTLMWYLRLIKLQLAYGEWYLLLSALGVELIPLGVDISLLPVVISILIAKQTFFAQMGYLLGGFVAKMGLEKATGLVAILARLIAMFAVIGFTLNMIGIV